jgi:hypothetical protein
MQEHTIFPANEDDFFKIGCSGKDTFSIEIEFHPSSDTLATSGFSFSLNSSNILGDFKKISETGSGSMIRYKFSKDFPDTLFFQATARKYSEYSITLRRE